MPPSPGRIHDLPSESLSLHGHESSNRPAKNDREGPGPRGPALTTVKILYSLDTSSQSYVTVLPERQQVYIHPSSGPAHAPSQEGVLGSCYLKAAVRGICFAR